MLCHVTLYWIIQCYAVLCNVILVSLLSNYNITYHIISWYVVILSFTSPFPSILSSTSTIFDPPLPYLYSTPSNALSHEILLLPSPFHPSILFSFLFISNLFFYSILFYYFSPLLTLFLPSLPLSSPPLIFLFSFLPFSFSFPLLPALLPSPPLLFI